MIFFDYEKYLLENRKIVNDCWEWTIHRNSDGYGKIERDGDVVAVHRLAAQLWLPNFRFTLHVLHKCDNPPCFNPNHLFQGTYTDNNRDRAKKNRSFRLKGDLNGNSKLTDEQVLEIRRKYTPYHYPQHRLAKEYSVSTDLIHKILSRKMWKHL